MQLPPYSVASSESLNRQEINKKERISAELPGVRYKFFEHVHNNVPIKQSSQNFQIQCFDDDLEKGFFSELHSEQSNSSNKWDEVWDAANEGKWFQFGGDTD